jgi:hypothetical protein
MTYKHTDTGFFREDKFNYIIKRCILQVIRAIFLDPRKYKKRYNLQEPRIILIIA